MLRAREFCGGLCRIEDSEPYGGFSSVPSRLIPKKITGCQTCRKDEFLWNRFYTFFIIQTLCLHEQATATPSQVYEHEQTLCLHEHEQTLCFHEHERHCSKLGQAQPSAREIREVMHLLLNISCA